MANASDSTMAIVAEIFAAFPGRFRFTSGCRTPSQNAAVNGNANSYHLTTRGCLAADFVPIDGNYPPGEFEQIESMLTRHGYELIKHNAGSGMHYHIEPAPGYTGGGGQQPEPTPGGNSELLLYGMLGILFIVLITD